MCLNKSNHKYHRLCYDEYCKCDCHSMICYACGSNKTFVDKRNGNEYWIRNHDRDNNILCDKCYAKYFTTPKYGPTNNKKWNKINSGRIIAYKGKNKLLKSNPKTGKCSKCGKVRGVDCKRTSIHHEVYHDDNLLMDTVELCNSCHSKRTYELGQMKSPPAYWTGKKLSDGHKKKVSEALKRHYLNRQLVQTEPSQRQTRHWTTMILCKGGCGCGFNSRNKCECKCHSNKKRKK